MAMKSKSALMWDLLTFDRLVTGPVIHLIYWAGLGVISLVAFSSVGAAVGVALRETAILGKLLALPVAVAGLLVASAMVSYVGDAWNQQQKLINPERDPHAGLPGFGDDEEADGYGKQERNSLDKLLDQQEKSSPGTTI